jgi:NAD(P)-dependent dehydrogenase (short-subunit alcohol dehydrogenase family)
MATALVTGTSSGIGLATAIALARAGHTVAATMRNLEGGAEIRKIAAEEKLPIHLSALDVDDDASVREAFAKVVAQHRSTFSSTTPASPAAARLKKPRLVSFVG